MGVGAPPIHPPPPTLAHKPRSHYALAVSCPEPPDRAAYRLNHEIQGYTSEGRYNIHEIAGGSGDRVFRCVVVFAFHSNTICVEDAEHRTYNLEFEWY